MADRPGPGAADAPGAEEIGVGPTRRDDAEVERCLTELDRMLEEVEAMPGSAGVVARDAVAALAATYGEALARAVAAVTGAADAPAAVRRMADDPLLAHLMALHGVHPDPVERRVAKAAADLQSDLGGACSVEVAGIEDGVVRLRVVTGTGVPGLPSAARDAVLGLAPELDRVEVATERAPTTTFIPVTALRREVTP